MPGEASPELLEQARELLQWLIQHHIEAEQQYVWYILLSIPIGILFFLVLTRREQAAHLQTLWDKLRFFFSPFAPESFVIVLDSYGWHVGYDVEVIPGKKYNVIRFAGKEYRMLDDPRRWAEPLSLLDMKAPPGIPSPFGLVARLVVSWMLALIFATYAFSQTAYISYFAYHINPTWIDVLSVVWFGVVLAWFIRNVLELHRSTGMGIELWVIPPTNIVIPATPGPQTLKEWKDLLLRSLRSTEAEKCEAIEKLAKKLEGVEDEEAAAQIIAMARDAIIWRQRYAELEEQLDKHVEAAEAAALRAGQPAPVGGPRLWRWMPWIVVGAILLALVAVFIALQPSVHSVAHNATTTTTYTHAVGPATPPPPPSHPATPAPQPATPPPPPGNTTAR